MTEELTPERLAILKARSCEGKRRYETERDAHKAAKRYRKNWGSKMSVYECRLFCKGWHFGHDRKKFLQKKYEALSFLRFQLALFYILLPAAEEASPVQDPASIPETASEAEKGYSPSWSEDLTMDSFSESVS